jgi:hypothetical protein
MVESPKSIQIVRQKNLKVALSGTDLRKVDLRVPVEGAG